jgi:hypothetical protein
MNAEVAMKAEQLRSEFTPEGILCGDQLLLLRATDAVALVNEAADEGVPILAVEGGRGGDWGVESPREHVADYSRMVAEGRGCWAEAEAFIRAHARDDLVFAVKLGDDPIEAV